MVADDRNILLGVSPQGSAPELLLLMKASGGVGSSRPRSQGVEEVFFPHQPAGDKGSVDGPARLLGPSSRSLSGVDDQQHHSCPKSTIKGDSFVLPVSVDKTCPAIGGIPLGDIGGKVHSGLQECSGRPAQLQEPSVWFGVVSSPSSGEGNVPSVGVSVSCPVCVSIEQDTPGVLLQPPRSSHLAGGRVHGFLEQPGRPCVSSVHSNSTSTQQGVELLRSQDDFGSALLALEGVVPWPSKPSHRPPKKPPSVEQASSSTKLKQVPPEREVADPSCLEVFQLLLRERGFSERTMAEMSSTVGSPLLRCISGRPSQVGAVEGISVLSESLFRT